MKREWWSIFAYGNVATVCSKHKTLRAAVREARKCEKQGGAKHKFLLVQDYGRAGMDDRRVEKVKK